MPYIPSEGEIQSLAMWFREDREGDVPQAALDFLASQGVDFERDLVQYHDHSSYEDVWVATGVVVTPETRFFDFAIYLDDDARVLEQGDWQEATEKYPVTNHARGTPETFGWRCQRVLRRINGLEESEDQADEEDEGDVRGYWDELEGETPG